MHVKEQVSKHTNNQQTQIYGDHNTQHIEQFFQPSSYAQISSMYVILLLSGTKPWFKDCLVADIQELLCS